MLLQNGEFCKLLMGHLKDVKDLPRILARIRTCRAVCALSDWLGLYKSLLSATRIREVVCLMGQTQAPPGADISIFGRIGTDELQVHALYFSGFYCGADDFWGVFPYGYGQEVRKRTHVFSF